MPISTDAVLSNVHLLRKKRGFKDIIAWQRGMQLALAIYKLTARFPVEERYGLSDQMRRAAVSIPSNVAEGYGRGSSAQYKHAVGIARGSCAELESQMLLAKRLHHAPDESFRHAEHLIEEASKLLNGLGRALERKTRSADAD